MYMFEELPAAATATTRSWGAFSLSAVPRTGETVVLDDAEYVVESRRWTPKRVGSKVDRDSPMWRHQLEAAAAGPARGHCLVGDAGRAPRIWQRLPGPSSSPGEFDGEPFQDREAAVWAVERQQRVEVGRDH